MHLRNDLPRKTTFTLQMEKWIGRVAVVTGASSGIGLAMATALVEHGMKVIGAARNLERLKELENCVKDKGTFVPVKCDITNESDVVSLFQVAKDKFSGIDVLINNAGVGKNTSLLEGSTADWKAIVDTNVMGLSVCAREGVKSMKAKGVSDGYVVNIGSILAFRLSTKIPEINMYCGSKFAMRALTEGLRKEVRNAGTNIRVTHLSPGTVETEMAYKALGPEAAKSIYSSIRCLQPNDIADAVLYVLSTPPHVQVTELTVETTDVMAISNPSE